MALKVESATIEAKKRIIAISDVHGNLTALKKLLNKVNFTKDDVLVLLGDIVEKGEDSLKTLHYVMKLKKTHTVYTVCGNCDAISLEIFRDDKNKELLGYILAKKNTLVGDMCRTMGIPITKELDMLEAKKAFRKTFEKELEFIRSMPHILELNDFVFAHAAVYPEHPLDMKPSQVMKMDAFMDQGYTFDKYHIVGHWPTVLYSKKIPNCNPRIDKEHKIISIDGGNVLKLDGQLNALIIPDAAKDEFSYVYVDLLSKARILNTQELGDTPFCISWLDNTIQILRQEKEFSYCEHCSSGNKMWIPNNYLWEDKKGYHTEDITNYQLKLTYGDIVSVTQATSRGYLVKKSGICGWYYGMLEEIADPDDMNAD